MAARRPLEDAYKAVDLDTITLLLGMMIVVASLRLSGFYRTFVGCECARTMYGDQMQFAMPDGRHICVPLARDCILSAMLMTQASKAHFATC
jgi:ABC-type spermidine/putrescine transport system permease subunit II